MSSYLEKAQKAFRSDVQGAAAKVSNKRTFNDPKPSTASPTPKNPTPSPSKQDKDKEAKRKREAAAPTVFSQPADTGRGTDTQTQIIYIRDYLRNKGDERSWQEIYDYLGLNRTHSLQDQLLLVGILQKHPYVEWIPDPKKKAQSWDSGTYKYRPKINVRNKDDLIAYLQRKADAQGVLVKDLADGWADCEQGITELENEYRVLVTRTKKDGKARMVWANDPTLVHEVDTEFQMMWLQTELPAPDDLVRKLIEAGQKPASEDPSKRVKGPSKAKEKKKRPPRKGGRTTNTHMEHLLRDYDHLKR
jgi:transcription initiation factor TFIIE subunit beta